MGEEYRAKIFRSGNSLALRLPKALGLQEGAEVMLREEKGKFTFEHALHPDADVLHPDGEGVSEIGVLEMPETVQ